ncbi:MAG TPA: hypothetical protein VGL16_08555 [Actinomycetota bacterium]
MREERGIDVQLRQQVDEFLGLFAIGLRSECPLGHLELALAPRLQRGQFAEAAPDLGACVGVGLQGLQVRHLSSDPDGDLGKLRLQPLGLVVVGLPLRIGLLQRSREPLPSPWSEQVRLEKLDHARYGAVLPHVDHPRVLRRDEGGLATSGLAGVVGNSMALAPVHPEATGAASQEGPKQIRPRRIVGSGPGGLHDVVTRDGAAGGLLEHLPGSQGLVGGLL